MGKSKKRIFNKISANAETAIKRTDAIRSVISDIKSKKVNENTKKLIGLFGISPEELTESGLPYESLNSCTGLFL